MGPVTVALRDVTVTATPSSSSGLDVQVHHPTFASLPEQARNQVAFLALDNALGEELVELWLDRISAPAAPAQGTRPLADLPALVRELADGRTEDGGPSWSLLQGESARGPVLVSALSRLRSIQAPWADRHVAVLVRYAARPDSGWPTEEALESLRAFEDHLTERLAGSGLLVAVVSCAGERTLHYYVDSTTPALAQLEAAAQGWTEGPAQITSALDPAWDRVADYAG